MSIDNNTGSRSAEITAMTDGLVGPEKRARRVFRRYFPLIFVLWILFVLYPNPVNIIISVHRVLNFEVNPGAVQSMLNDLPSDAVDIEKAVLATIRYRHDWQVYGMPWYCPTVEQVMEREVGDCKGRALVLASVLEAKNVTYQVHSSPIHIWVEYESKNETSLENAEVEFYQYDPETGEWQFQLPHIRLSEVADSFWDGFWGPMPDDRKGLLISGPVALVAARVILRKKRTARLGAG